MSAPLVGIQLAGGRSYEPGATLAFSFQVDAVDPEAIEAIEASVLWYTEGKGDEDLAVHFFERLENKGPHLNQLHLLRQMQTVLPNSPLSYEGVIVKICWCVRVRLFLRRGKSFVAEQDFHLGRVPVAQPVPS